MTIKQLIAFIAVAWTFTFVVWGITVVSHNTVERVTAIEKVVKVEVSDSSYIPTIAKCDTTSFIADVKLISLN